MVLRFRDLIGDAGETIREHRKYIDKYGHVWWGWWSKPNEKIPRNELLDFQRVIKNNGHMWIYLADSGLLRLYKAKLTEIDITQDEESKECSDIEKVPEYYFTAKYKVWFLFSKIEDVASDEIRDWSHMIPSDFLSESDITKFQGKRVSSLKEILNQYHSTIYFIQPYIPKKQTEISNGSTNNNKSYEEKALVESRKYVQEILSLIEKINKCCDYAQKRVFSPIQIPPYQKEMERSLETLAYDEKTFRDFSSSIYQLFIDGHNQVMKNDSAIISKSEFLGVADRLQQDIRLFRCDLHHLPIKDNDKRRLGKLYTKVCSVNILDNENLRIRFQLELLKRIFDVLRKEFELVKEKVAKL